MAQRVRQDANTGPSTLTAISPLDGRYWGRVNELSPYVSEMALIRTRIEVEARYLVALSGIGVVRPLSGQERETLANLGTSLSEGQIERVKEIENTTRHDVKAMERAVREFVSRTSLEKVTEMIHFALTSEDVNNLSYRLMLKRAIAKVCVPALDNIVDAFAAMAKEYANVPMLARTHGQPAVPTTLGKEMVNIAVRLNAQVRSLEEAEITGKLTGAVGNLNAHRLAAPEVDWINFSSEFVKSLGLKPNMFTTQINPYDDMIAVFQAFQRVNGVILDADQDMWRYISDDWFKQQAKSGEVGSSTMPQKVNPIDFENSEGNLQVANSLLEGFGRKLAVSRLQRDLSDSTTVRNVGVALAYGLLAYKNTLAGLGRVSANTDLIKERLNENWAILTEGVQTILRREGTRDPYSTVAALSRGQRIGPDDWREWLDGIPTEGQVQRRLREMTPESYTGYAERLVGMALEEIARSRERAADTSPMQ